MSPAKYDILLLDDGELSEIRGAAHALGAAVHTELDGPNTPVEWPLVVSSTRYLERLESIAVNLSAKRLVVLDQLSQTLRARMRRARVDFFLCRPVHPEALRLLLVHCLYKGPERRQRRVAIGAPVRFRSGFRRGRGVLADLSDSGCRILAPVPLATGQRLLVFLPKPEGRGRTFFVRAEVVRSQRHEHAPNEMALRFYSVAAKAQRRIDELIAHHIESPAVFRGTAPAPPAAPLPDPPPRPAPVAAAAPAPVGFEGEGMAEFDDVDDPNAIEFEDGVDDEEALETDALAFDGRVPVLELDPDSLADGAAGGGRAQEPRPRARAAASSAGPAAFDDLSVPVVPERVPVSDVPERVPASDEVPPLLEAAPEARPERPADAEERRREPRRSFQRQVVALDRSATRILIGRDLSVGGMRVDPNPALVQAKSFRLSIHVGESELPLVVRARVARDDGDDGILLRFEQLGFAAQEHLRKSLRELPILAPGEDGAPERVLVTEMLDELEDGVASAG